MATRRLSDREILAIENPTKERNRIDVPLGTRTPGLYISVTANGTKSWIVRYRFEGRTRKFTVGRYPSIGIETAIKRYRKLVAQVEDAVDPQALKLSERKAGTTDLFPDRARHYVVRVLRDTKRNRSWIEQAAALGLELDKDQARQWRRTGTIKGELRWALKKGYPASVWQARNVAGITREEVAKLLESVTEKRGHAAATKMLRNLDPFYDRLIADGILKSPADSPTAGIKTLGAPAPEDGSPQHSDEEGARPLYPRELKLLWHAAAEVGEPWRSFIHLLILTGQRRSEVAGMQLCEFDVGFWERWEIPSSRTKNKREHVVPLSPLASDIVSSLFLGSAEIGLLLSTTGRTPISGFSRAKRHLDAAMQRLAPKYKLAPWSYHSIRKSVASGLADLRDPKDPDRALVPPHIISSILNHKSASIPGVTARYVKTQFYEDKKVALDAWADHVMALVGKQKSVE